MYPWLLEFLRTERNMRNPAQFAARVVKHPEEYPDLVALWRDRDRAPPEVPDPPDSCPTCGGTSIEVEAGLAECADCAQSWGLVRGRWVLMPASSRRNRAVAGATP
jgi:hypothetical protein